MYIFRIGNYDDSLCAEMEQLLAQRTEAESRRRLPEIWKLTDGANAYAAKGQGREKRARRYGIYGVFLTAIGIFALVPGLMQPQNPTLILAGAFALLAGALEFLLAGKRKISAPPKSCRKDAAKLIENLRAADFEKNPTEIAFDDSGAVVRSGDTEQKISYESVKDFFETERLWLLACDGGKALLLKKCDLISGGAEQFSAYIREKITANPT